MSNRRILVLAGAALVLGTAGGLLLSRPAAERPGAVRIAAPAGSSAFPPKPTPTPMIILPTPSPSSTPAAPGIDPPPPPQEKGSPDYAKMGVLPAI